MRAGNCLVIGLACFFSVSCATHQAVRARPADPQKVKAAEAGIENRQFRKALCLSGGGYRAMLFNGGALLAIEQMGELGQIDTITSVSGGSFLNGRLAVAWPQLRRESRVRMLLEEHVISDIQELADVTIDVPAVVKGAALPFKTNSALITKSIDKYLVHGASLADIASPNVSVNPHTPIFIFQTTDLATGRPWFFTTTASSGGPGRNFKLLDIPLSTVIAASSAFPPIITPVVVDFTGPIESGSEFFLDRNNGTYGGPVSAMAVKLVGNRLRFTDGGISDNKGLSECERAGGSGLISDAAVLEFVDTSDKIDPLSVALRVSDIIYSRAERETTNRVIQSNHVEGMVNVMLGGMKVDAEEIEKEMAYYDELMTEPVIFGYKYFENVLYWAAIRNATSFLDRRDETLSPDAQYLIDHLGEALCHSMISTRLKHLDREIQNNILNVGYISALSALEMRIWSELYRKYWLVNEKVEGWDARAFPVLLFDPPRKVEATLKSLGQCKNQAWVDAFFENTKIKMEPLIAAIKNAPTSGLLPTSIKVVDEAIGDEFAKAVLEALQAKLKAAEEKQKADAIKNSQKPSEQP